MHGLIEHMLDGFAIQQIILDTSGKLADCLIREVNRVFEEMTGLSREQLLNRRAAELDAAISFIADGVILFDPQGHILRVNAAAELLLANLISNALKYSQDPVAVRGKGDRWRSTVDASGSRARGARAASSASPCRWRAPCRPCPLPLPTRLRSLGHSARRSAGRGRYAFGLPIRLLILFQMCLQMHGCHQFVVVGQYRHA